MNINDLINELKKVKRCNICYLTYMNKQNEISRYKLFLNWNIENTYKKDLIYLNSIKFHNNVEYEFNRIKLIDSINNSLNNGIGYNDNYNKIDCYYHINNSIKLLKSNNMLYIKGFIGEKRIIVPTDKKNKINNNIYNEVKNMVNFGKFREFIISVDTIKQIKLNKKWFWANNFFEIY